MKQKIVQWERTKDEPMQDFINRWLNVASAQVHSITPITFTNLLNTTQVERAIIVFTLPM